MKIPVKFPVKIKPNYFVIPLITVATATLGSVFTNAGMAWYDTALLMPSFTPPKIAFPIAWTVIFILTAMSALIFWNSRSKRPKARMWVTVLFLANAVLNVLWTFLFFYSRAITESLIEMIFLEATTLALIFLLWKISRTASLLLLPYFFWVGFATYLTYEIVSLNT